MCPLSCVLVQARVIVNTGECSGAGAFSFNPQNSVLIDVLEEYFGIVTYTISDKIQFETNCFIKTCDILARAFPDQYDQIWWILSLSVSIWEFVEGFVGRFEK